MGDRDPESGRSATESKSDGVNNTKMLELCCKYMNNEVLLTSV
jgi:hypothetical protein